MNGNFKTTSKYRCTICQCQFDLINEGGVIGEIGILPVNFCPTCKAGIMDFADQCRLPQECERCGHFEGDEYEYDFTGDDVTRGPVLHSKRDV